MNAKGIHLVDLVNHPNEAVEKHIPEMNNDYIRDVIHYACENEGVRKYTQNSDMTEVVTCVLKSITHALAGKQDECVYAENMSVIANRLLRVEKVSQKGVERLGTTLRRGSLVQAIEFDESRDEFSYVIAKIDYSDYRDGDQFDKRVGFPDDVSKVWKSCVFSVSKNPENGVVINRIRVYVQKKSEYWADDFLELVEISSNEENSRIAFHSIEQVLAKKLKSKYPSDYNALRNDVICWFRKNNHFDYGDFIDGILTSYTPFVCSKEEIENLKDALDDLPEKKGFDRQFILIPEVVTARIRSTIELAPSIELRILDGVDNLRNVIQAECDDYGARFIKIRTDNNEAFQAFNWKAKDESHE